MSQLPRPRWNLDTLWVAAAAAAISTTSFVIYYRAGDVLLYGDAVAHINIARRVFDSRTPGILQLGTVWLPLPHLLIMPFVASHRLWQTGIGGSIPSMIGYVLGVVGIFRLVRAILGSIAVTPSAIRFVAWAGAALYALNPNIVYLQATAMTESLYLALFIWAAVYFQEFLSATEGRLSAADKQTSRSLWKSGICAAGASLTRYDGWFLAAVLGTVLLVQWVREGHPGSSLRLLTRFALLIAAVPVLWLAYNATVYRNPLEFANGPYSAKAIDRRASLPHPGTNNLPLAALYFVKGGEINVAEGALGALWFMPVLATSLVLALKYRRLATSALLWSPVAFYALSIAYGGVPLFMPHWYPFSAYNVRYGQQLLPAFAVFLPIAAFLLTRFAPKPFAKRSVLAATAVLVFVSYVAVWRAQPVCYREARINSRTRVAFESQLAAQLSHLPPDTSFLMYLGGHVGALQQAGIPLRRSVNEGNHRVWVQPADPQGLWERSLANPAQLVDFVVAIDGDPVADATRTQALVAIAHIAVDSQPQATIYRTH